MYSNETLSIEDIASIKESMNRAVWQAMTTFGFDNGKGTLLYNYQVEYCYLIDSIERDSNFIANKQMPKIKELIYNLKQECVKHSK